MNDEVFKSLEKAISKDRLEHYAKIFNLNSNKSIIKKYILNVELSKSLYFPLQTLETTLRNSIHEVLTQKFNNEFWFENESFINPKTIVKGDITTARSKIENSKEQTSGRIISELNFGFWSYLFGRYYEQKIWNKYVKQIFPNIPKNMAKRRILAQIINTIKNLRNKVFHFDTIVNIESLFEIHNQILEVIKWLNKDIYNLVSELDDFDYIYKNEEKVIEEKLDNLLGESR